MDEFPDLIVEEILINLNPRDIAAAAMVFPRWENVIKTKSFLNRMKKRYSSSNLKPMLKMITVNDINKSHCMELWSRTVSNHCAACLVNPSLLLYTPDECCCFCTDHIFLHYVRNIMDCIPIPSRYFFDPYFLKSK